MCLLLLLLEFLLFLVVAVAVPGAAVVPKQLLAATWKVHCSLDCGDPSKASETLFLTVLRGFSSTPSVSQCISCPRVGFDEDI